LTPISFPDTFEVDTESFVYEDEVRYRTFRIRGVVWDVGGRGRSELVSLPDILPSGTAALPHPSFSIAGHLIAVALTGVDNSENLVPVSNFTNNCQSSIETEIRKLAQQPAHLTVTVTYYEEDPRIARTFHYLLRNLIPENSIAAPTVLLDKTMQQPWATVSPVGIDPKLSVLFQKATMIVRFLCWRIESITTTPAGSCNFKDLNVPPPERRPYAGLDWLMLDRGSQSFCSKEVILDYIQGIENGTEFLNETRAIVLRANPILHRDFLCSDAYGSTPIDTPNQGPVLETFQALINGGGNNAPQVDHIVPRAAGGANCFSNAQVTSMHYNSHKQDNFTNFPMRSEEWKREQLAKLRQDPKLAPFL
jgi:hypothetical protein